MSLSGLRPQLLGALAAIAPALALAQQPPTTTAPGQIEREFQQPLSPPKPAPKVVPPTPTQQAPTGADTVKFVLTNVVIEGVTIYRDADLRPFYAPLLGKQVSLAQVFEIARNLTNKYRNDGYVLSQVVVGAQSIDDGIVHMQAIEGYIAKADLQGKILGPRGTAQAMTDRIAGSRPLNANVLERNLLLLNDVPGVTARAVLGPSSEPNASDLSVDVDQRRGDFAVDVNNRGSRSLGPVRADISGGFNSLLWGYDRLGLRAIRTLANNELTYISGSYDRLLSSNGLKLNLTGGYVNAHPEPILQNQDLPTNSKSAAVTLEYPFIRSRITNLSARASFSYYNGTTDEQQLGGGRAPLFRDNVRAARAGASYDVIDSLRGINLVDVEVSQGLKVLGYSDISNQNPRPTNAVGRPDFTKITFYAARLQSLFPQWSALFAVSGQHAFNPLPAPEQFAVGGEQFGRAYDSAEILGDSGVAFKTELRFNGAQHGMLRDYMVYAFYDIGQAYLLEQPSLPGPSPQPRQSIASAGLGVRFTLQKYVTGYIEGAVPLTKQVTQEQNKDARIFGGIRASF